MSRLIEEAWQRLREHLAHTPPTPADREWMATRSSPKKDGIPYELIQSKLNATFGSDAPCPSRTRHVLSPSGHHRMLADELGMLCTVADLALWAVMPLRDAEGSQFYVAQATLDHRPFNGADAYEAFLSTVIKIHAFAMGFPASESKVAYLNLVTEAAQKLSKGRSS
jgi:hypothetical protein